MIAPRTEIDRLLAERATLADRLGRLGDRGEGVQGAEPDAVARVIAINTRLRALRGRA